MDILYGNDRKFGEMEDADMADLLESDMFQTSTMGTDSYMDNDWLNSFFDDPVLNDKMITDAAQPPCIKSEHSYSLNDQSPGSPFGLAKIDDIDADLFGTPAALDLTQKHRTPQTVVKQESLEHDPMLTTVTTSPSTTLIPKQPTIILASPTTPLHTDQPVFPQVTIKQEPPDAYEQAADQTVSFDQIVLPPTPPSSASSDSEGSQSPQRSAPSSPVRQLPSRQTHQQNIAASAAAKALSQPIFVNPIPQSGVLFLSDEEKRTLISEGYPIPGKLPLTKQEEKNLKKIRRKIKNKISAQESRRKKKEYLEALEKRVESYTQENGDLKKRVDSLENNNRSLLGQLQKLQALVGKMPRPSAASATQTGTVLMVLVLSFAVFLGSWAPTSLNIGYSSDPSVANPVFMSKPNYVRVAPGVGPSVKSAMVDSDYSTPNMKSRVLLSLREEQEEEDDFRPHMPWEYSPWCASVEKEEDNVQAPPAVKLASPEIENRNNKQIQEHPSRGAGVSITTVVKTTGGINDTQNSKEYQATMHPDIAVSPFDFLSVEARGNITAEIETS